MARIAALFLCSVLGACAAAPPLESVINLKRQCRYDEARQLVLDDLPKRSGHERAQQLLLLASVEEHAGKLEAAIGYYHDASFAASGSPTIKLQALQLLGMAQARAKQYAPAIASFSDYEGRRSERAPSFGGGRLQIPWDVHAAWAVSLAELGRFQEAAQQFASAAEQSGLGDKRDALLVWQGRAQEAEAGRLKPEAGSFWAAAYGGAAAGESTNFSLVPVYRKAPFRPDRAGASGGFVDVQIQISTTGEVIKAWVIKSEPGSVFDEAALRAVREWRFMPKRVNCRPVPGEGVQRFVFPAEDPRLK